MHGHYKVDVSKLDESTADGLSDEAINMGIAIVLPVTRILDIINTPELIAMRAKADAEAQDEMVPAMDSTDVSSADGEFERFEDLTRKLAQVPKAEVDEKRKA
jgi:hypothetical protein